MFTVLSASILLLYQSFVDISLCQNRKRKNALALAKLYAELYHYSKIIKKKSYSEIFHS
jgi:hypothetical protein